MKIEFTFTAEYADPLNAENMLAALQETRQRLLHEGWPRDLDLARILQPGIGEDLLTIVLGIDWVRPVPPKGTAYVVVCRGNPVASFSAEHLAEHYVDHADEPQHCSIEEVETD